MQEAYGTPMVTLGQGGSIPLCNVFAETYPDAEIILMGVEEPLALIHAPNESVDPSEIAAMALAEALFLQRYAGRLELTGTCLLPSAGLRGRNHPHAGREERAVADRVVEPQPDHASQLRGVTEVHRVCRSVDDGDRQVLRSEPGHLADAVGRRQEGIAGPQDGKGRDGRVQQSAEVRCDTPVQGLACREFADALLPSPAATSAELARLAPEHLTIAVIDRAAARGELQSPTGDWLS